MKHLLDIKRYNQFVLAVTGLGGLLYGIDIGVIDPALPYLNRSTRLSEQQMSLVVAAVLAGSIFGSVIAGALADWLGRKKMMIVSGLLFVASVAIIYASRSYLPLITGRLLQGLSGGVIAVVVPLYLAETLPPALRGRGVAVFQFMLTVGIVVAAFVGAYFVGNAEHAIALAGGDEVQVSAAADQAWRGMFLAVMYPGILFLVGAFFVAESPRWLVRRGQRDAAQRVLQRMRPASDCEAEWESITASIAREQDMPGKRLTAVREILTQRRYVLPFVLACIVLACNQTTGINSLLQFMSTILQKAGLEPVAAAGYGTAIKIVNSAMTIVAIILVERRGRVFLLKLGTAGIVVSLLALTLLFYRVESQQRDVSTEIATMAASGAVEFDLSTAPMAAHAGKVPMQLTVLYSHGEQQRVVEAFTPSAEARVVLGKAESLLRSLDPERRAALADPARRAREEAMLPQSSRELLAQARQITTASWLRILPPSDEVASHGKPLRIERATLGPVPSRTNGLLAALCIAGFIAAFSVGPGVCVWLVLSELLPTRIRSVGMGIALLLNQGVGTLIAATFLPIVGNYGYHAVFAFWAACTVVYFLVASYFLPETKGKSLEEIELSFSADAPRRA